MPRLRYFLLNSEVVGMVVGLISQRPGPSTELGRTSITCRTDVSIGVCTLFIHRFCMGDTETTLHPIRTVLSLDCHQVLEVLPNSSGIITQKYLCITQECFSN